MRTCELFAYNKRFPNPRYEDLPVEAQEAIPEERVVAIERVETLVFGYTVYRFHVWIVGSKKAMVWSEAGKRIN